MISALEGDLKIVNILLNHGARVNAVNAYGITPLMVAAFVGYKEVVNSLLAHNPHINAPRQLR